jgi:hypothetical protein
MLRVIKVTNHLGESLDMELRHPEKSGFLVHNVDGLGPPKATINKSDLSSVDGSIFNSSSVESRNVVLHLAFTLETGQEESVEELRHKCYKYFPIKKKVTLTVETDKRTCKIDGYVESNEVNIFNSIENTAISVVCPEPYLEALDFLTTILSGVTPQFEFPFSNESLVTPLIELGEIFLQTKVNVNYTGDATTGMVIYIHSLGTAGDITLYNEYTLETMTILKSRLISALGSGIVAGDELIISTVKRQKYAVLLRNGVFYNVMNCLEKYPDWFQLSKGDNVIGFTAVSGSSNLQMRLSYKPLYEGV